MSERRRWAGVAMVVASFGAVVQLAAPSPACAAVSLINRDGPGEGFNDPTPATPVGGNTGTTIGEQRLIAFQHAVDLWAERLDSPVEIRISATFDPLDCSSTEVTLGEASPVSVFRDFRGAPLANTLYPSALADRLAGADLAPEEDDIEALFNSRFGTTACKFPSGWYYGLDASPPGNKSDMVTVVLHELGHGFGFLSFVNVRNGARFDNRNDVFLTFLLDDRSDIPLAEMTNAQRRAAIIATTHLKWFGEQVVAASGSWRPAPTTAARWRSMRRASLEGSSVSHWSDDLFPNELMEPFFTHPLHDVGLAAEALADIGWSAAAVLPRRLQRRWIGDDQRADCRRQHRARRISAGKLRDGRCRQQRHRRRQRAGRSPCGAPSTAATHRSAGVRAGGACEAMAARGSAPQPAAADRVWHATPRECAAARHEAGATFRPAAQAGGTSSARWRRCSRQRPSRLTNSSSYRPVVCRCAGPRGAGDGDDVGGGVGALAVALDHDVGHQMAHQDVQRAHHVAELANPGGALVAAEHLAEVETAVVGEEGGELVPAAAIEGVAVAKEDVLNRQAVGSGEIAHRRAAMRTSDS